MLALSLFQAAPRFAVAIATCCLAVTCAIAQPAPASPTTPAGPTLDALGWLHGCWQGKVNLRDFREEWLPLRGEMMVGVSQTVLEGRTVDFEYLRLEPRSGGIFYIAVPSGKKETSFRLTGKAEDGGNEIFTFENTADEFPQRLIYRRGTEGWLYAHVEGTINGEERKVIYPMRRVDCRTGELLRG